MPALWICDLWVLSRRTSIVYSAFGTFAVMSCLCCPHVCFYTYLLSPIRSQVSKNTIQESVSYVAINSNLTNKGQCCRCATIYITIRRSSSTSRSRRHISVHGFHCIWFSHLRFSSLLSGFLSVSLIADQNFRPHIVSIWWITKIEMCKTLDGNHWSWLEHVTRCSRIPCILIVVTLAADFYL